MIRRLVPVFMALSLTLASSSHAHLRWVLPSNTVLSDAAPVTFDVSVSNDVFHVTRPYPLSGLRITDPDGKPQQAVNQLTGERRSVFDVMVERPGTSKVELVNTAYFIGYTDKDGERQRWRGDRKGLDKAVAKARKRAAGPVAITESHSRLATFVTLGAPSKISPTKEGLDVRFDTHPNDLYAGESLNMMVTFNGEPVPDLKLSLVPGGTRYRDDFEEKVLTTNAEGRVSLTWPEAGLYLLVAEHESDSGIEHTRRRDAVLVTLEVLPL